MNSGPELTFTVLLFEDYCFSKIAKSATVRRPAGPVFNSHVRKGVVERLPDKSLRPEGPTLPCHALDVSYSACAAPAALDALAQFLIHALTDVAIECQPFGPAARPFNESHAKARQPR